MPYKPPDEVGDYGDWTFGKVIYNGGRDGWSVAEGTWCEERALGIRWNGGNTGTVVSFPKSSRRAVWFIVPTELQGVVETVARMMEQLRRLRDRV